MKKKAIIEFKNTMKEIEIPLWVYKENEWLNTLGLNVGEEEFQYRYNNISEWFENKAIEIFKIKKDIYLDGFLNLTNDMIENNVDIHCKILEW